MWHYFDVFFFFFFFFCCFPTAVAPTDVCTFLCTRPILLQQWDHLCSLRSSTTGRWRKQRVKGSLCGWSSRRLDNREEKMNPHRNHLECGGLQEPHWATLHLLLLKVASLSCTICTYAYQGRPWMCFTCFCAPFTQLCGSVLIHDPGQKCMSSSMLLGDS